jgi:hypothetical protein
MRGSFWNSDGFKDTAKHNFVRESIRDFKLDFFVILETGRGNFSTPFLNNISGGQDYQWYCVPPIGHSGGILVGINASSLSVQHVVTGDRCVKFYVTPKKITLSGFYLQYMGLHKMNTSMSSWRSWLGHVRMSLFLCLWEVILTLLEGKKKRITITSIIFGLLSSMPLLRALT